MKNVASAIRLNIVSESEFTVKGHGVHTAYVEHVAAIKKYTDYDLIINSDQISNIVHAHTVGPYSLRKFRLAKNAKIINAHVTPGSFIGSLRYAKLWAPIARVYLRYVYNQADHVVCVSPTVKQELLALGVKRPMSVIPNMIELSNFKRPPENQLDALRQQFNVPQDRAVIVSAGQVQPRKAIGDFISVAQQMPDHHFLWIGGIPFGKLGEKTKDMEHLMKNAPDNVTFTGVVELAIARQLYHLGNIFWLPSYQETFGLVVIEAAACGLPIILRDIAVYEDIFTNAYLKTSTPESCIRQIQQLLTKKSIYKRQQQKSISLADNYSSQRLIQNYSSLYRTFLK